MLSLLYRRNFTELWLTLQSNETLGILDTEYLEDYFGQDGQLTLLNIDTEERTPIPMAEVTPHDTFRGAIDLNALPEEGDYRIEGRVRNTFGDYTILSELETPLGIENVVPFTLSINTGIIEVIFPDTVNFMLGFTEQMSISSTEFGNLLIFDRKDVDLPLPTSTTSSFTITTQTTFPVTIVKDGQL